MQASPKPHLIRIQTRMVLTLVGLKVLAFVMTGVQPTPPLTVDVNPGRPVADMEDVRSAAPSFELATVQVSIFTLILLLLSSTREMPQQLSD